MVILQLGSPPVVEGSTRNLKFPGGIPVQSVTWGKQRPVPGPGGGQANPGPTREGRFLVKAQDVDGARLVKLASTGTPVGTAKVNFLNTGAGETSGTQIVLSNTVLTSFALQGGAIEFSVAFSDFDQRFLTST
jgi:hypothetical protein